MPTERVRPGSLLQILRSEAWLIVAAIVAGLVLAVVYINLAERRYAVTLMLIPTEVNGMAQKSIGGGLGSLASLAGVELPGGGDSLNFDLLPDAMVSRETAATLASDPAILHATFPKLWNAGARRWEEPTGTVYELKKSIRSIVAVTLGFEDRRFAPPGPPEMQEFLVKRMAVTKDRKRPVITVAILHSDPAFARSLLYRAWLVSDQRIKETSLKRSQANIAYLSRRLSDTLPLEYRLYLYTAMSQEEKRRMTTSSSLPFVAEPFGAPVASKLPVAPNAPLALIVGPLAMLALAIGAVIVRRRREIASLYFFAGTPRETAES